MTRGKIKLAWVTNATKRKNSLRKRKQGLEKKMEELTTLCDIDGCLFMFNPEDGETSAWPSEEKAKELLARYEGMPKIEQTKKLVDQEGYMKGRVEKLKDEAAKHEKRNKEMEANLLMYQMFYGRQMEEFNVHDLELLIWYSDEKLKRLQRRLRLLEPMTAAASATQPCPP